jgi:F-type H+-transporting ATPase subunit gamma
MVAASKLRRAQERVIATRPFSQQVRAVLASVVGRVDTSVHPLLTRRAGAANGPTLVIALSGDRGLCGSFNTNVVKAVASFITENPGRPISLGLVGRKGRDMLSRRGLPVRFEYVNLPKNITANDAEAIAAPAIKDYTAGKVDSVYLIYNEFKSVMQQRMVVEPLLPLTGPTMDESEAAAHTDYIYEPSAEALLEELLPRIVLVQILRAMLESNAAFYAAQMTAMDAATRNSADMISGLTLYMNKIRQAAITREIIEVVSGAQAL